MKFYVYALLDPSRPGPFYYGNWKFEFEPFYIGKGQGKRAKRHLQLKNAETAGNSLKDQRILKLFRLKLQPIVEIKRNFDCEDLAFNLERKLIALIGRKDKNAGPLANKTSGGEGYSDLTETQRIALSNDRKDWWASLTRSERENQCAKQAVGIKRFHDSMSTTKKKKWIESIRIGKERQSPERKAEIGRKLSEVQLNISSAERKRRFKRRSLGQQNMQADVKQLRSKRIAEYWANQTVQKRELISRNMTRANLIRHGIQVRYKGRTCYFKELWSILGIVSYRTACSRYRKGWSVLDSLSKPLTVNQYC